MLPWKEIGGSPVRDEPVWMPISMDIVVGALAAMLVFLGSLALGGFSFIEPWLILCAVAMLACGLMRGASRGNLILKPFAVAAPLLFLVAALVRPDNALLTAILLTILPVAAGIALRRLTIHAHSRKVARLTH